MLQKRDFRAVHSDVSQASATNPLPASGAFVDVADPWEQGSRVVFRVLMSFVAGMMRAIVGPESGFAPQESSGRQAMCPRMLNQLVRSIHFVEASPLR
jgi:hypothetical protein